MHKAHPRVRVPRGAVQALFHALDEAALEGCFASGRRDRSVPPGEISVALLDDREISRLHQEFFHDPTATDVITFPGQPDFGQAGEICVSADTARRYADTHRADFSRELSLYLVHGYLHLAGFDDQSAPARRAMRLAERKAMDRLTRKGKLPDFAWIEKATSR